MAALRSCAFTGHRPAHFSFQYDELAPGCVQLKSVLEKQILRLYHRGITDFYTGCALGVDLWAGEAVLSLKRQNPDLQLHCIIPFEGQERRDAITLGTGSWWIIQMFCSAYTITKTRNPVAQDTQFIMLWTTINLCFSSIPRHWRSMPEPRVRD